ncbi:hypothetical protein EYR27_12795 [Xanthomonas oryzae]|nr:hypothetical protein EYR27_12795 [Xanthomonas oryzae]
MVGRGFGILHSGIGIGIGIGIGNRESGIGNRESGIGNRESGIGKAWAVARLGFAGRQAGRYLAARERLMKRGRRAPQ